MIRREEKEREREKESERERERERERMCETDEGRYIKGKER